MTRLDSLITPTATAYGNTHPDQVAALARVFGLAVQGFETTDAHGVKAVRRVGLPSEDCVTPAIIVACGILASWADEEVSEEDRILISAGRAKRIVAARWSEDRLRESREGIRFDPTDNSSDVITGSGHLVGTKQQGDGDSLDVSVVHRPDRCTVITWSDRESTALDLFQGEPKIVTGILDATGREPGSATAVLRAAGLPVNGKGLAKSKVILSDALAELRLSGDLATRYLCRSRVRAPWSDEAKVTAASGIIRPGALGDRRDLVPVFAVHNGPADEMPDHVRDVPTEYVSRAPSVVGAVSGDVATSGPSTPLPNVSPGGALIGRDKTRGIPSPSRKARRGGQTGPTVPVQLRAEPEIVVIGSVPVAVERFAVGL